jgi:hypothetical protein
MEDEPAREWSAAALTARGAGVPESVLLGATDEGTTEYFPSPSRVLGGVAFSGIPTVEERSTPVQSGPAPARSTEADPGGDSTASTPVDDDPAPEGDAPAVAGIQTGSFRDPENAAYMAQDIRSMGFAAEIRTTESDGATFYKVLVPLPPNSTPGDAQETVVRLKERGVEGFLVFD